MVIGNPPWEIVKPDLREYYAQFDPDIESHLTREQAEKRIAQLDRSEPGIQEGWEAQQRRIEEDAAYYKTPAASFAHQGRGDTALHKLFLERVWGLLKDQGRLGYVVPSGIYTDLGTKDLRQMLLTEGGIQYLFSFSNERFFFHGVHHDFKFVLLGAAKGISGDGFWTAFRFNPRTAVAPDDLPAFLANSDNLLYMKQDAIKRFSPDSLSIMEFQGVRDYTITEEIYNRFPLLGAEISSAWQAKLNNEFHFTNDRQLFNQQGQGIPLYEGKMIHQFDAFYARPQFWIDDSKIAALSPEMREQLRTYRVVHRRITNISNERTLIAAVVPPNCACEINATVILIQSLHEPFVKLYVSAILNSFILDYIIRQRIAKTLNMFYMYQLPVPRLTPGNPYVDAIVPRAARLTCTRPEFAGLWQEVMGGAWEPSCGAAAPDERWHLRDEIDALVAHLYGLSRPDFEHILGTFPLVFPDTEEGQDRKEQLLGVYDALGKTVDGWERV